MSRKDFLGFSALAIASLFGVVGVITELLSHAASPIGSTESETGVLGDGATGINDPNASGDKAIEFGLVPNSTTNLLVGDSANFENGTVGVWSNRDRSAMITNTTDISHSGSHSLKIITGATTASGPYTTNIPVIPGNTYTLSFWAYTNTSGVILVPGLNFYNSSGTLLLSTGPATILTASAWTHLFSSATAPANSTYAILTAYPKVNSSPTTVYIDDCALFANPALSSSSKVTFPIGVSMGSDSQLFQSSDHGASQYAVMKAAGFTSVRIDAFYNSNQVAGYDATIRAAISSGLDVLIIIDGYDISIGPSAFGLFCKSVVTTYSALGCHTYEILNEENTYGNWDKNSGNDTVSPAGYASLLTTVYGVIKAADPKAVVITGGTGSFAASDGASLGNGNYYKNLTQTTWMSLVYAALNGDSTGAFDAVGVHPYTYPNNPTQQGGDNFTNALSPYGSSYTPYGQTVRTIMVANGDANKKLWITEFGAPTGNADGYNTFVTEAQQAAEFSAALTICSGLPYVAGFYCFTWNDDSDGDFGMNDATYSPKPALSQVQQFI